MPNPGKGEKKEQPKKGHMASEGRDSDHLHAAVTWSDKGPLIKVSAARTLPAPVTRSGEDHNCHFFPQGPRSWRTAAGGWLVVLMW